MEIVFNLQKSMQRRISPVFLRTITTWDAYGLFEGRIIPALSQASRHLRTSDCN